MITLEIDKTFQQKVPLFRDGISVQQQLRDGTVRAMYRALGIIWRRVRVNLSGRFLNVRSGRLINSIKIAVGGSGDEVVGVIGTPVFYGRLHDQGVPGPWIIRARNRKALRFTINGRVVFATKVTHPGLRRRPWLTTAFGESLNEVHAAFPREYRRVLLGESILQSTLDAGRRADQGDAA